MYQEEIDAKRWEQVEEAGELLQEGRVAEGLTALRDVIKAHPDNPYAFDMLGDALFEIEKFAEARDAYRAALRVSPDFLGARVALSHTLRALGDAKGALVEADAALSRFPKDGEAHHAKGLAYAALGQRKKAQTELEGFLDSSPEFEAQQEVRQVLAMLGLGEEGEPVDFE